MIGANAFSHLLSLFKLVLLCFCCVSFSIEASFKSQLIFKIFIFLDFKLKLERIVPDLVVLTCLKSGQLLPKFFNVVIFLVFVAFFNDLVQKCKLKNFTVLNKFVLIDVGWILYMIQSFTPLTHLLFKRGRKCWYFREVWRCMYVKSLCQCGTFVHLFLACDKVINSIFLEKLGAEKWSWIRRFVDSDVISSRATVVSITSCFSWCFFFPAGA